jgi:hypothetical protein
VTDLEQLILDLSGAEWAAPRPVLSKHVRPGPARLLRRLVVLGLDPQAIEAAAALVAALDQEPTA